MNIEIAKKETKIYFDHSVGLQEMFITEDRQCFYKQFDASSHCKRNKGIKFIKITREDFREVAPVVEVVPVVEVAPHLTPKQKLQAEATGLGIEFEEETTSKDLKIMIDLKKEE